MELLNNKGEIIPAGIEKSNIAINNWDLAHDHLDTVTEKEFVEPNIETSLYGEQVKEMNLRCTDTNYLCSWPQPKEQHENLLWHLNDSFSQLRKAKNEVISKIGIENCKIKIAIIDTGYQVGHPALPQHLDPGTSFIKGETGKPAIDRNANSIAEQNGHGTATMSILAGKKVKLDLYDQKYEGEFGAIPFAEIIPIRICETVALIRTSAFVDAVNYAIDQGCEVISMSMAGAPTKAWSTVVNRAYENGVIMVTAAGNSWYQGEFSISPRRLLYPARWDRVIAATGVAYDHKPYVMEARIKMKGGDSEDMQGNYGPESAMKSALAAYTPNILWAANNQTSIPFRLNGGGTSSATPQIAAAAALWIVYHRNEIESLLNINPTEQWKKVEMVKNALFAKADHSQTEYKKYFGQGILKSYDALGHKPSVENLEKAQKATVSLWGIKELIGLLTGLKKGNDGIAALREEMFEAEIMQALHQNNRLHHFLDYDETTAWTDEEREEIKNELLSSPTVSERLKNHLQ